MHIGITPTRISFAGGGSDMPEFYEEHGGAVISTAISQFTYSIIHPRKDCSFQAFSPDFQKHYKPTSFQKLIIQDGTEIAISVIKFLKYKKGVNIILCSDVPAGSGLGASSSLAVNLVHTISALKGEKRKPQDIAETAFHIGRKVLSWPIGKQDEYISAFGGFNYIRFNSDRIRVTPIRISKSSFNDLQQNLLLFFVGDTRNSAKILTGQIDKIKNNDLKTMSSLNYVRDLAERMYESLRSSDITQFGELLHTGWLAKKKFTKRVSNKKIDSIYEKALRCGASGGKLTGAGGGGHMLFYVEQRKQHLFVKKMQELGLKKVDFAFYNKGPKILNVEDMVVKI